MAYTPKKNTNVDAPPALPRIYAWFSALVSNDLDLLEDLHAHGIPIDVFHPLRHTTALMEATRLGRTTLVDWLLARGAAPAFLCGTPLSAPLHSALRRQHWEVAAHLIEAMSTAAIIDSYGRTPLHVLCTDAQDEVHYDPVLAIASALIDKNCPLDALDHEGITALHHCVINDAPHLAELLLDRGAKPDAMIPDSWVSPLTIAALERNLPMAELLLSYGANPELKTREGSHPASICPEILKLLKP